MNNFEDFTHEYVCCFLEELDDALKSRFKMSIVDDMGGLRVPQFILNEIVGRINNEKNEHTELVDHPDHYNEGSIECIEAMRRMYGDEAVKNFCNLTAFKYYFRRGNKVGEDFDRDTKKAEWYLDYMKKLPEKKNYVNVNWGAMK